MRRWILPLVVVLIAVAMVFAMVLGMDTEPLCGIEDAQVVVVDVEVLPPAVAGLERSAEFVGRYRPASLAEIEQDNGFNYERDSHPAANITRTGRSFGAGVYDRFPCRRCTKSLTHTL